MTDDIDYYARAVGSTEEENRKLWLRVEELEGALARIRKILERPAGNRKMMQIALPARTCMTIIKAVLPST